MVIPLIYLALLLACCVAAYRFGGFAERWAAIILVTGSVLSFLLGPQTTHWGSVSVPLFAIDFAGLVAFIVLARLSDKYWPIWVASLQLLSLAANVGQSIRPSARAIGYAINEQVWSWAILLLVIVQSLAARRMRLQPSPSPEFSGQAADSVQGR